MYTHTHAHTDGVKEAENHDLPFAIYRTKESDSVMQCEFEGLRKRMEWGCRVKADWTYESEFEKN